MLRQRWWDHVTLNVTFLCLYARVNNDTMNAHTHTVVPFQMTAGPQRALCISMSNGRGHTHTKSHKAYNSSTLHTVLRTQSTHIKHCYCQPIFTLEETVKVDIIYIICPYRQWPSYPTTSYFSTFFQLLANSTYYDSGLFRVLYLFLLLFKDSLIILLLYKYTLNWSQ